MACLVVYPVVVILHILALAVSYIIHYSRLLCRLASGMIFFAIVIGFLTGLGSGEQLIKKLVVGVGMSLIPRIGDALLGIITLIRFILIDRIHG